MKVHLIAGLGFGDEGKGTIVDTLVRRTKAQWVIRYNGGAQAAHNVITPDGRHHTFAQFGSGYFAGANTYLSRHVLIDPLGMDKEADHLQQLTGIDPFQKLYIDQDAPVITFYHRYLNRLREKSRGDARHGSCGMGIGELMADITAGSTVIRAADLGNPSVLTKKLDSIMEQKMEQAQNLGFDESDKDFMLMKALSQEDCILERYATIRKKMRIVASSVLAFILKSEMDVIFEGAQGVLLDEWYGFHPYTTWSTCTFENALDLLRESRYHGPVEKMGVIRAFHTRHGTGPFPTEIKDGESIKHLTEGEHNKFNSHQRDFRVGHLDLLLLKYAIGITGGINSLAVTHLDKTKRWQAATSYSGVGQTGLSLKFKSINTGWLKKGDLEKQGKLAQLLFTLTPNYTSGKGHFNLLNLIEQETGVRVSIESHGPTWNDKVHVALPTNQLAQER